MTTLSTVLAVCESERIAAGTRRDGSAVAHVTPVLHLLEAMAATCTDLSSKAYLRIDAARQNARHTKAFCELHDRAARGEIELLDYEAALSDLRWQDGAGT